ncbi:uncharacterized protein LOC116257445 isoform X2 [Nymphaea colorata]|uniref:uncharacterized protein LOC116257445 isoform X2 n=1 Tax=Nymphaea colorata TaxID=210225 RepID=UPI00129E51F1|nr:uncharacterized protein LOC116257445 isoform X2 [Nymphaea colorata]
MCRQEADLDENLSNTEGQEGDETLKEKGKIKNKRKRKRKRKESSIPDFVDNMKGIKSDAQSVQEEPVPLANLVDRSLLITEVVMTVEECGTSLSNSSPRTQADDADFETEFLIAESEQSIRKKKKAGRNSRKGPLDADASMTMKHFSQENPICSSLQSSDMKTPTGLTNDHINKPPEEAPEDETFVEKKVPSARSVPLAKEKRHKRKQKLDKGSMTEYSTTAELLDKTSQSTTTEGEVDCVSGKCLKSIFPAEADAESADCVTKGNLDRNNQATIIPCTLEAEKHNHKKKKDKKKDRISSVDKNLGSSEEAEKHNHKKKKDKKKDQISSVDKSLGSSEEAEKHNHKKKKDKKKDGISSVDKNLGSSEAYPSTTSLHSSESTISDGVLGHVPNELCKSKMIHDVPDGENLEDDRKPDTCLSLVNDDSNLQSTSSTHKETNMLEKLADLHVAQPLSSQPRRKLLILDLNGLLVDVIDSFRRHLPQRKPDKKIGRRLVFKRPFCDEFLEFCFRRFDVGIWSSLMMRNLQPVVEFLLGNMRSKLLFCWDGSFCTITGVYTIENRRKPLVLKELKKIWEKEWEKEQYTPSCTLLVDDSPYKALFNPAYTGIFPRPFMLHHEDDNALGRGGKIRVYLEGLVKADDVREYIKNKPFGQPAITTNHPDWDFYKQVLVSKMEDDSQK